MKKNIFFKAGILLLSLLLLPVLLGCGAISSLMATSTPTITPSPTYTATPTITPSPTYTPTPTITPSPAYTPTPTLTPLPDLSSFVLTLDDLPPGFSAIETGQDQENQKSFVFANARRFEIISGVTLLLKSESDILGLDMTIGNPNILTTLLEAGLDGSEFTNIRVLPGMDVYGDLSNGYTSKTVFQGISMMADFFGMRKGDIGTFVMIIYNTGDTPPVTIQEIAKILDARISKRVP